VKSNSDYTWQSC